MVQLIEDLRYSRVGDKRDSVEIGDCVKCCAGLDEGVLRAADVNGKAN
jgi:hypothetical protein